jgi:hypothetical protein
MEFFVKIITSSRKLNAPQDKTQLIKKNSADYSNGVQENSKQLGNFKLRFTYPGDTLKVLKNIYIHFQDFRPTYNLGNFFLGKGPLKKLNKSKEPKFFNSFLKDRVFSSI